MKIDVLKEKENVLLGRKEIDFICFHPNEGTPIRYDIRKRLGALFNADIETVYIRALKSEFGRAASKGLAMIYNSPERALEIEREHIIKRNQPTTKDKGSEEG